MTDEEEATYTERADYQDEDHDGDGDDYTEMLLCSGFLRRDQRSRRRRQLGLREDPRGSDGECGAGGCAEVAVVSECFEDCFHKESDCQFTACMHTC